MTPTTGRPQPLGRPDERRRILSTYGPHLDAIMVMLERQFAVLHNRAQVLLTLGGIVISTTGFSGRLIAGTNRLAQGLVVAGMALVLVSAAVVVLGVLHLRWLTTQSGDSVEQWLEASLRYRDRKTNWYRTAIWMMLLGLTLYGGAIAVMLLNPAADVLPAR